MYFGYLFDSNGYHTARVELQTERLVFAYCITHCKNWPRIVITDTDDYCVLEVISQQMKIPLLDGSFKYLDLSRHSTDELLRLLKKDTNNV